MKLLIVFDKNIEISPEKICVHVSHSTREITYKLINNPFNHRFYSMWQRRSFKTVLLRDKITDSLKDKINNYFHYEIYDAGLDGVFKAGTVLGYAVLVSESDETFKRLRTLKFDANISI